MAAQDNNTTVFGSRHLPLDPLQFNGISFGKLPCVIGHKIDQRLPQTSRKVHGNASVVRIRFHSVQIGNESTNNTCVKASFAGCVQVSTQRNVEVSYTLRHFTCASLFPLLRD